MSGVYRITHVVRAAQRQQSQQHGSSKTRWGLRGMRHGGQGQPPRRYFRETHADRASNVLPPRFNFAVRMWAPVRGGGGGVDYQR